MLVMNDDDSKREDEGVHVYLIGISAQDSINISVIDRNLHG